MNPENDQDNKSEFRDSIASREKRRIRAEKKRDVDTWSALGVMGVVGWTVALPTVIGSFLGLWMDYMWPYKVSWTLTMLGAGLFIGCVFAGLWLKRQKDRIVRDRESDE